MKIIIDTEKKILTQERDGEKKEFPLYSKEAFELISDQWMVSSWSQKYSYTFTWMGRPIIQHPEDLVRFQEVVYTVKPDVIIETGIAHGGSLIFSANLCQGMGRGRVVGVDIEIRPHNRKAIEAHDLFKYITLIEGSSIAPDIFSQVKANVKDGEKVLIVLDSNHSRQHVLDELNLYHALVSKGSYIVATDGIMRSVTDLPDIPKSWVHDNPYEAAQDFVKTHPEFKIENPPWQFNESELTEPITGWPGAYIKKR